MKMFAGPTTLKILSKLGMKEGDAIEHPMLSRSVGKAQRKVLTLLRKDLQLFLREAALAGVNAKALAGLVELLTFAERTLLDAGDYSALHALTAGSTKVH